MNIPKGWRKGRLGEECSLEIGGTPSRNVPLYWDDVKEHDNIWVSIRDLNRREIVQTSEHITDAGVRHSNVKLQPQGTILLSFKLSIGRVAVAGIPLYTNEAIVGLQPRRMSHDFLYQGLQTWDLLKGVDQAIKGATLNKTKLKVIEFCFPESDDEQVKIAEVLSMLDSAIEQNEAMIKKQERIKAGLMQDLFLLGIDLDGELRSEATHTFQNSSVGRIPSDWRVLRLESIGTWASGGTPSKANPSYWGDEVPWICPRDMKTFDLTKTNDSLTRAGVRHGSREVPAKTVFIVVRGMILAHTFPVCITSRPTAFNQDVKAVVVNLDIDARFFAYWLTSHANDLLKLATSSTHGTKRFDMKELFDVHIAIPEKDEQQRIVSQLDKISAQIEANTKGASKLRSVRSGLMRDLLTGTKLVTKLLEPIQRVLEAV